MPQKPRSGGAVRPPCLTDHRQLRGRGPNLEAARPSRAFLQGDVSDRPGVGPAQRGKEVDLGRPRADPGKRHQRLPHRVVVERGQAAEVERALLERRCKGADVARLLPAEAVGPQLGVARPEDPLGRQGAEAHLEPAVRRARRGEGYLLLEDEEHQRGKTRVTRPELGEAVRLDDRREIRIGCAERGRGGRERRLVEHDPTVHRRHHATVRALSVAMPPPVGYGGVMSGRPELSPILALGLLLLPR